MAQRSQRSGQFLSLDIARMTKGSLYNSLVDVAYAIGFNSEASADTVAKKLLVKMLTTAAGNCLAGDRASVEAALKVIEQVAEAFPEHATLHAATKHLLDAHDALDRGDHPAATASLTLAAGAFPSNEDAVSTTKDHFSSFLADTASMIEAPRTDGTPADQVQMLLDVAETCFNDGSRASVEAAMEVAEQVAAVFPATSRLLEATQHMLDAHDAQARGDVPAMQKSIRLSADAAYPISDEVLAEADEALDQHLAN